MLSDQNRIAIRFTAEQWDLIAKALNDGSEESNELKRWIYFLEGEKAQFTVRAWCWARDQLYSYSSTSDFAAIIDRELSDHGWIE